MADTTATQTPHKIAIALVHGSGKADPDFAKAMIDEITARFQKEIKAAGRGDADDALVFEGVNWAPLFANQHEDLWF